MNVKSMFRAMAFMIVMLAVSFNSVAQPALLWKKGFGGNDSDVYRAVTTVADGAVAVGYSFFQSFGNGDWAGVSGKGGTTDATIVKYDNNGAVVWKNNFGGNGNDLYRAVTTVSDGIIAVGSSMFQSFGNGDWVGVSAKGEVDAIIVKYDNNGTVVWKKSLGSSGSGNNLYNAVTTVADGIIVAGWCNFFGTGDWAGIPGKGSMDAIIVKYDFNGAVLWKKNFGGSGTDVYTSVITVADGIIAAGTSTVNGTGDWTGIPGKGEDDAIIVKYDFNGAAIWKNNFGGISFDYYQSITAVADGIVAVGASMFQSFGNGDWAGVSGKGGTTDAIIVKHDNNGAVAWKKNFGSSEADLYNAVTAVADGIIAAGYSSVFGNGDWTGVTGKGGDDAIIVKYDFNGAITWKKNFGGSGHDTYESVTANAGGIIAAGYSLYASFGNGDWAGVVGKGSEDAIIVKYENDAFISVTDISDVPTTVMVDVPLTLTATVTPSNATNQTIVWSVVNAGSTGATITGDIFIATAAGAATIKATIANGAAQGTDYTQNFTITVSEIPPVITTATLPDGATTIAYSATLEATGTAPITWSLEDGTLPTGLSLAANGTISGTPTTAGIFDFTVKAANGGGNDVKPLTITITATITPPVITTTTLPDGAIDVAYTTTLEATGTAPIAWSLESGNLPTGLTLYGNGNISGAPTTTGTFTFTVTATNSAGSDTKSLSITITATAVAPTITTTTLPDGTTGIAYHATLEATGTATITWSLEDGNLPNGLNIYGAGIISGTPTTTGTFTFTVKATNGVGNDSKTLTIKIDGVGIDELGMTNDELRIYPNPTNGELRITNYELGITNIEIFDMLGHPVGANLRVCPLRVHPPHVCPETQTSDIEINISHLPTGIYFIRIETENGNVVTRKVVKN